MTTCSICGKKGVNARSHPQHNMKKMRGGMGTSDYEQLVNLIKSLEKYINTAQKPSSKIRAKNTMLREAKLTKFKQSIQAIDKKNPNIKVIDNLLNNIRLQKKSNQNLTNTVSSTQVNIPPTVQQIANKLSQGTIKSMKSHQRLQQELQSCFTNLNNKKNKKPNVFTSFYNWLF